MPHPVMVGRCVLYIDSFEQRNSPSKLCENYYDMIADAEYGIELAEINGLKIDIQQFRRVSH